MIVLTTLSKNINLYIVKMRIGIDIDDCITQTVERYCELASELFSRNIIKDQLLHTSGKLEAQGMVTTEEFQLLRKSLAEQRFFKSILAHTGAINAIKELNNKHQVFFITSRDDYSEAKEDTLYWLQSQGIISPTIFFSSQKDLIIKDNKIDIFIDDRESYVAQALNAGAQAILFTQPWNIMLSVNSRVNRFSQWGEISQFINSKN